MQFGLTPASTGSSDGKIVHVKTVATGNYSFVPAPYGWLGGGERGSAADGTERSLLSPAPGISDSSGPPAARSVRTCSRPAFFIAEGAMKEGGGNAPLPSQPLDFQKPKPSFCE